MALISLVEWAEREGIDSSTARHKAIKGLLRTAHKIGRNWVIDDEEVNVDNRKLKAKEKVRETCFEDLEDHIRQAEEYDIE